MIAGRTEESQVLYSRSIEIFIRSYGEGSSTVVAAKNKRNGALASIKQQKSKRLLKSAGTAVGKSGFADDDKQLLFPSIDSL